MRALLLSTVALLAAACDGGSTAGYATAAAPLLGVDGSADQADRACHVVLRSLARVPDGGPGYETDGSSWVFSGALEISEAAAAEGLAPAVIYQYGSDPTWWRAEAEPAGSAVAATPGFVAYTVRLDHDLPGPGMSGTALDRARVQVVPVLALDAGGRLFDHNRLPGDFDNYVLGGNTGFAIGAAPHVCPAQSGALPTAARLVFGADFQEQQVGALVPGGAVRVEYDIGRVSRCQRSQSGRPAWDATAYLRWEPSGELRSGSVRDAPATFDVPAGAARAVLWFEATNIGGCHEWDSDFEANYTFAVQSPPEWLGGATVRISRDTNDPCESAVDLEEGFDFDTWGRQRAAFANVCVRVYQPGLTDGDAPPGAALDVSLRWRGRGTATEFRTVPGSFDRRVGNDARYAIPLRAIDPFALYHCPDVPTTRDDIGGGYEHAAVEYYLVANGKELRPAGGGLFTGTFTDALDGGSRGSCAE